jgi:hypothetical protein
MPRVVSGTPLKRGSSPAPTEGAAPILLPVDDAAKPCGSAALDLGFFF